MILLKRLLAFCIALLAIAAGAVGLAVAAAGGVAFLLYRWARRRLAAPGSTAPAHPASSVPRPAAPDVIDVSATEVRDVKELKG